MLLSAPTSADTPFFFANKHILQVCLSVAHLNEFVKGFGKCLYQEGGSESQCFFSFCFEQALPQNFAATAILDNEEC